MTELEKTAKPLDILRVTLLTARNNVINSINQYDKFNKREDYFISVVRPNIKSLYLFVKPEFDKSSKVKNILEILDSSDINLIIKTYYILDDWLSQKKLTSMINEEMLR